MMLLEIRHRPALPVTPAYRSGTLLRATEIGPAYYRFLAEEAGCPSIWREREALGENELGEVLEASEVTVLYLGGAPAGWFEVIPGDGRGKRLGYPTANLAAEHELVPAEGVYAAWAVHEGRRYAAMVNIGRRPTFPGANEAIEVHLIDFEAELYGHTLDVHFVDRVRCERSFASADQLQRQLARDQRQVLALLGDSGTGKRSGFTRRRKDAKGSS